jgi:hypothetical protein
MILTDEEKRMRDGAEGAATAAAMNLLIRYGDALGCDRLCDVRNVAGSMTQPSPVRRRLVAEGGWDRGTRWATWRYGPSRTRIELQSPVRARSMGASLHGRSHDGRGDCHDGP